MALWDRVAQFLALVPVQERSLGPIDLPNVPLSDQLSFIQRGGWASPWRSASTRTALGVPAIFRAVSLIANTTGALTLEAYRDGTKLPQADRPRLIVRPNPFTTPRDFFRDTAWSMASKGEAWWWIAARDGDGAPLSLIPANPSEIVVTENDDDLLNPRIEWRGRRMRNEDMRQITMSREPGALRGIGPLQACGAEVSVAVEAQEFAANFFAAGGWPSIVLKSEVSLSQLEADELKARWTATPHNTPRVLTPELDAAEVGVNQQGAQMLDARLHQVGEVARMFGIPGSLLDHQESGSSLTYQNLEGEFGKFVRACLWPNYLEPIEQAMTDLLSRSTVARFHLDALLRADMKTRFEVYGIGIDKGILTPEEARQNEGLEPGDVENAPVPFAQPQAVPASLPIQGRSSDEEWRCAKCNRKIAERIGYGTMIVCRCGQENVALDAPVEERALPIVLQPAITIEQPAAVQHDDRWAEMLAMVMERNDRRLEELQERSERQRDEMIGLMAALASRPEPPPPAPPQTYVYIPAPELPPPNEGLAEGLEAVASAVQSVATRPDPSVTVNTPETDLTPVGDAMVRMAEAIEVLATRSEPVAAPPNIHFLPAEPRAIRRRIVRNGQTTAEMIEEPA